MCGALLPLSQYAFMAWCSVKAQDNFNFTSTNNVFLRRAVSESVIRNE